MFDVTATGELCISEAVFQCMGSRDDAGTWTLTGHWAGNEKLNPGDFVDVLFPGLPFDPPPHVLPSITFTSASATLIIGASCSFACVSSIDWPEPFGIPVGLSIDALNVAFQRSLTSPPAPPLIQASGTFCIDGKDFDVVVYFKNGSPELILVDNIPELALSTVLRQFGSSLPGDFLDLSFCNSRIYYSSNGNNAGVSLKPPIVQGLNISSQVTLELAGVTFPVIDVAITITSKKGISLTGSLDQPVGLAGFLELTCANAAFSGGPTLSVVTLDGQNFFGLKCGFVFLGANFGQAGLTISNQGGKTALAATLSFKGKIGPFTDPSLSMTYLDGEGFKITNWPGFDVSRVVLDFAKLLQQANSNAGCGQLVDLVLTQVETEFTIIPRFTTAKPDISPLDNGQFYLVLDGFYTISVSTFVVCSVGLPPLALSFALPTDFSFDTLKDAVAQAIVDNGLQVVTQLYNDPAALAKFIAVFVGVNTAKQLAQGLCDTSKNLLDDFLQNLDDSGGGAGSGVLSSLGAAASAIAALGKPCGDGGNNGGTINGPNIQPLCQPVVTSRSLAGLSWTLIWKLIPGASYYQVQVFGCNRKLVGLVQCTVDPTATITFTDFDAAPYTCQLTAVAVPGLTTNSPVKQVTLRQLATPTGLSSQINFGPRAAQLVCSFSPVPYATGYTASVLDGTGGAVFATSSSFTLSENPTQVTFTFGIAEGFPIKYRMGVICTGGDQFIPSIELTGATQMSTNQLAVQNDLSSAAQAIQDENGTQTQLYLTGGGNIGIGASDPQQTLDVNGTVQATGLVITRLQPVSTAPFGASLASVWVDTSTGILYFDPVLSNQTMDFSAPIPIPTAQLSLSLYQGVIYLSDFETWSLEGRGGFMRFNLNLGRAVPVTFTLTMAAAMVDGIANCPISITVNGTIIVSGFNNQSSQFQAQAWEIPQSLLVAGNNTIQVQLDFLATTQLFIKAVTVSGD